MRRGRAEPCRRRRGTIGWLTALGSERPALLLLDDLHWADPDSLDLLGFLSRRHPGGLTIVAALRPWPPAALDYALGLESAGQARIHRVVALSDDATTEVLGATGRGRLEGPGLERLLVDCRGNPLLLAQAGALLDSGHGSPDGCGDGDEADSATSPGGFGTGTPLLV